MLSAVKSVKALLLYSQPLGTAILFPNLIAGPIILHCVIKSETMSINHSVAKVTLKFSALDRAFDVFYASVRPCCKIAVEILQRACAGLAGQTELGKHVRKASRTRANLVTPPNLL